MAPENMYTSSFWLDNNRHSPRIFHKNAIKFDISTVNSKIDFMRSLDLLCAKDSYAKANWEVLLPKNSIPLKQCSVVINSVKCNYCSQSLKNQNDIDHHKNIHRQYRQTISAFHKEAGKDSNCNYDLKSESVKYNAIECNNNNDDETLTNENKITSHKKILQRKKSKNSVTKVTLKIGREVISKVYCKRKYLNKNCPKNQNNSTTHDHENCDNCSEIKERLRSTKITAKSSDTSLTHDTESNDELSNREARIRKMATLLVEYELQRKALQDLNNSTNCKKISRKLNNDDAVVPELTNETNSINDDDDICEILCITKVNDIKINGNSGVQQKNNTSDVTRRNDLCTTKHAERCDRTEIITIDDDLSDDSESDCVIIEDDVCTKNSLINEENSYIFHVTNKGIGGKGAADSRKNNSFIEKRKSFSNLSHEVLKKRKFENVYSQYNTSRNEKEKENKNYQVPAINMNPLPYH